MPENFEQMVATTKNYFPPIFRVLLGTTKVDDRDAVCFSKKRFNCVKDGKIHFYARWPQNSPNGRRNC